MFTTSYIKTLLRAMNTAKKYIRENVNNQSQPGNKLSEIIYERMLTTRHTETLLRATKKARIY